MEVKKIWVLRGPNIWARCPVLEIELLLGDLQSLTSRDVGRFAGRLLAWLPGLEKRPANDGQGGTLGEQLQRGTSLAHVLGPVTLELQVLAGSPVKFNALRPMAGEGAYRVAVEYEEEELGVPCVADARELCLAAVRDTPFEVNRVIGRLREVAYDVRLGPSTAAIVRAARRRNIPVRRLNTASLVQLGQGVHQRRICTAETDRTSAIAEAIAQDKQLTRSLLKAVGVPVPEGRPVADAEDAWQAAEEIGPPVVVKPQYGNHGRGVATNLTTREQVLKAYEAAREESTHIIVESFAPGADHRLLVIGGKLVAAALREPAHVIGDGRSTIAELVAEVNKDPRRSDGHATALSYIKLDAVGLAVLAEQGYTPESVPPGGAKVLIRRNGNLSTGGTAADVTDRVHPEVAARAVEAARVVGLDIAGVDVVAEDIGRPLEVQRGAVVEVNAGPGLRMHLEPSAGKPRPVGEAVVGMLVPEGRDGRIPLIAVTGVNGKTTTTRLLAHLLTEAGKLVGMTCTDGAFVGGRRIHDWDCSGPRSARDILLNPRVEAAVLETARGGILREGLGFDQCSVGLVTNIGGGDHLGMRDVETPEELARVKRTVVEAVGPGGAAVLNAADPLVATMALHCPGEVIFFTPDAGHPLLAAHRREGGRVVFVRGGAVVLGRREWEEKVLPLSDIPLTHGGKVPFQVENALAAAAAAWALGLPLDVVRRGLTSFAGDDRQSPGRFNMFTKDGGTVIVDFAHNPSALAALVAALDQFPHRRRTIVFTGFHRRDADVIAMGKIVGEGFDRVILYEDHGHSARVDGELNALLLRGLAGARRVTELHQVDEESAAICQALDLLQPGELIVLGVESIKGALALVRSRLEEAAPAVVAGPRALVV